MLLLTSNFCFYLSLCVALRDVLSGFEWTPIMLVAAGAVAVVITLVTVYDTLLACIVETPTYSIRFPKHERARTNMAFSPASGRCPKITVHVPCHREPAELVIATLSALSRQEYPDFEVVVVDNNTEDSALWRPVEQHCLALGGAFKFFHVEPLAGAKAGAMNFALTKSDANAEIVAAVDADYIADPEFLSTFVRLFDDPNVAFVQSSHGYRDWRENLFLSSVYYLHLTIHKIVHPAVNEFNAATLVGTMCLVRRKMLEEVGGWAEWSLTEDDELSMRLLAKGYTGHVFADTLGRGLIPDTFEGVKKQLFRWWAGAIQEFRVNWRVHLGLDRNCKYTPIQRMLRVRRMLGYLASGLFFVPDVLVVLLSAYMVVNDVTIYVTHSVLSLLIICWIVKYLKVWVNFIIMGGSRMRDCLLAILLGNALRWNAACAFFVPVFKLNMPWVRTDKFQKASSLARAFYAARVETVIGLLYLAGAWMIFQYADFKRLDMIAVFFIYSVLKGLCFSSALVLALLGEYCLKVRL